MVSIFQKYKITLISFRLTRFTLTTAVCYICGTFYWQPLKYLKTLTFLFTFAFLQEVTMYFSIDYMTPSLDQ